MRKCARFINQLLGSENPGSFYPGSENPGTIKSGFGISGCYTIRVYGEIRVMCIENLGNIISMKNVTTTNRNFMTNDLSIIVLGLQN